MAFVKTSKRHRLNGTFNMMGVFVTFNDKLIAEVDDDKLEFLLNYDTSLSEEKIEPVNTQIELDFKQSNKEAPAAETEVVDKSEATDKKPFKIGRATSDELIEMFRSNPEKYPGSEWKSISGVSKLRKYALSK